MPEHLWHANCIRARPLRAVPMVPIKRMCVVMAGARGKLPHTSIPEREW